MKQVNVAYTIYAKQPSAQAVPLSIAKYIDSLVQTRTLDTEKESRLFTHYVKDMFNHQHLIGHRREIYNARNHQHLYGWAVYMSLAYRFARNQPSLQLAAFIPNFQTDGSDTEGLHAMAFITKICKTDVITPHVGAVRDLVG